MTNRIEYEVCLPSSYSREDLIEVEEKFKVLNENIYNMVFHKPTYSDENMLISEETYLIDGLNNKVTDIVVDLDWAIDEFYIEFEEPIEISKGGYAIQNKSKYIHIEVVTKKVAEMNDSDFGATSEDDYEVGGTNSYYTQIGDTDFYYREM